MKKIHHLLNRDVSCLISSPVFSRRLLLCGLSATAVAAPAKPAAAPQPVSADPAATTAAYGDWVLRSQRVNDKTQLCEVAQTIQMTENEKTLPIAQIAFNPVEALRAAAGRRPSAVEHYPAEQCRPGS